ncbi:MAG: hypothetical protein CMK70_00395 [Pseudohongiella sp.]|nr:hypothetical protein [Pseudohongiella sp.]
MVIMIKRTAAALKPDLRAHGESQKLPRQLAHAVLALVCAIGINSCQYSSSQSTVDEPSAELRVLASRYRIDFDTPLNSDAGWAAAENQSAELFYDYPFRLRVQTVAETAPDHGHELRLQYRRGNGQWLPVGMAEFPYPAFATPMVSTLSATAYQAGEETERLLGDPELEWDEAIALSATAVTPVWRTTGDALEWEWPLVIRRFSDGPSFAEDEERFEFRLVDGMGLVLGGRQPAPVILRARAGHLGGTFVETPARLGPYQSATGHLYFIMEPSETDNRFMMVKSVDDGRSWFEVDGDSRPSLGDLEGVGSVQVANTIHIIHQTSDEVVHHAFEMSDGLEQSDAWVVTTDTIAQPSEPPTQVADVVARSDGSLVAVYGGATGLYWQLRSSTGEWQPANPVNPDSVGMPVFSGPVLLTTADDSVVLAYTSADGQALVRVLDNQGQLSVPQRLSDQIGTREQDVGAILPLVGMPDGDVVIVYRESSGLLYERRLSALQDLGPAVRVTERAVVSGAVDSDQVGADVIQHEGTLHLILIDETSRDIYHTRSSQPGEWSAPVPIVEGIDAGWLRGSVHRQGSQQAVYGFVYDAGSQGGSGFNRYLALPL